MAVVASATIHRRRISPTTLRNTLLGLAFCSPWLIGLIVFRAYPIGAAFWYSLTDYQGINPPQFIGVRNYVEMMGDYELRNASLNTLTYTVMAIPAAIVTAFGLALILNSKTTTRRRRGWPSTGRSSSCRSWCRTWRCRSSGSRCSIRSTGSSMPSSRASAA
jgi:ABC-type sugar transport system permease subunit